MYTYVDNKSRLGKITQEPKFKWNTETIRPTYIHTKSGDSFYLPHAIALWFLIKNNNKIYRRRNLIQDNRRFIRPYKTMAFVKFYGEGRISHTLEIIPWVIRIFFCLWQK